MALSPNGRWLAAAQESRPYLWRLNDEGEWVERHLAPGPDIVQQVAFDPDSRYLAAGSFFGEIALWDVWTGTLAARPVRQQYNQVYAVAFNQDGSLLASGSLDGRLVVWDVALLLAGAEASPDLLVARACQIANRNLTTTEWDNYFGDEPYRRTCPENAGPA